MRAGHDRKSGQLNPRGISFECGHSLARDSFLKGAHLLGQCAVNPGETIVEHALACGITLPTNCTSGTCGTCMVSLILGEVPLPEVLPGLDDWLVEEGARLGCIGKPRGDVDIDIRPPI